MNPKTNQTAATWEKTGKDSESSNHIREWCGTLSAAESTRDEIAAHAKSRRASTTPLALTPSMPAWVDCCRQDGTQQGLLSRFRGSVLNSWASNEQSDHRTTSGSTCGDPARCRQRRGQGHQRGFDLRSQGRPCPSKELCNNCFAPEMARTEPLQLEGDHRRFNVQSK